MPATPFALKYTKIGKVGGNYHVYLNTHQYSVPYNYVNQNATIIYDKETVEIYNSKLERIAIHKKSHKRFGYSTIKSHMPANHLAFEYRKQARNANMYLSKAKKISFNVEYVIQMVLDNAACYEQAYNTCEAILQLHRLEPEAFIKTCEYVQNHLDMVNYKIINQIMKNKIYLKDNKNKDINTQFIHKNLRGKNEYRNNNISIRKST